MNERTRLNRYRRCAEKYARLIALFGGICQECKGRKKSPLSIHHIDKREWEVSSIGYEARLNRYLKEYEAGVRLTLLCLKCNGSDGAKRMMKILRKKAKE